MERRAFLKAFGLTAGAFAAACVLDPEMALWKPGAKTIVIPRAKTLSVAAESWDGSWFQVGDVFTIGGCAPINPVSGQREPTRFRVVSQSSARGVITVRVA
jgi:hypothetical protein